MSEVVSGTGSALLPLTTKNLCFEAGGKQIIDHINLSVVSEGVTVILGPNGAGKSVLLRLLHGLLKPTGGDIRWGGNQLTSDMRKRQALVFQRPVMMRRSVADNIRFVLSLRNVSDVKQRLEKALDLAGLKAQADQPAPKLSGGEQQRLAIARALAMQPEVLICDEPVASLDVSIQAQIINLFLELQSELGLTCVFISHDLSVVQHVSDRVAVMYLGRIVELGPVSQVFGKPAHPYTAALFDSVPKLVLDADELVRFDPIEGEVPSPLSPPKGCHYHPRCPLATSECSIIQPLMRAVSEQREAACHHFEDQLKRSHK